MTFSTKFLDISIEFFLGNPEKFSQESPLFQETFLNYVSDCNSSAVREAVTLHYLKYESYTKKHGADGVDPATGREKEVKPRFFRHDQKEKPTFGGNFNDMTLSLLEKKKHMDIVVSTFRGNDLLFIAEFPMSDIYEHLKKPILDARLGKRVVCPFSYTNVEHSLNLKIHFYNTRVINKTKCLSKRLVQFLENHA